MSIVATAAIVLAVILACLSAAALWSVWDLVNGAEEQVGPWHAVHPEPAPLPALPSEYRLLTWAESTAWKQQPEWERLVRRLFEIELGLGGDPSRSPAPAVYSPQWLENRILELEELSGPMPGLDR